ncbi:glycosylphosphatidylinositol anchor attachment 1 protein-like [Biomphalaria glabrata]|uniref:Glycosylphosphatidylinositol anchor attachment 1 protein-like n=1 Tax=Biomphalaria glabrata TaxID=6526 RepID=A0A9W3AYE2_BIOGL|nr:glycosylphosphatidylinositol anchor attachment 1 protein-like [Biomphalaria glabrata]XP_055892251.1 glycosylphosphatidylinositol anchor attachment 1 protein-like [Biomphalaria glabrata]
MGILTDETQRNRLISLLVKYCNKLCALLYVVGLIGFLAQAYQPLNAGTYFSENALLPGLVETELPNTLLSALTYRSELEEVMKKEPSSSPNKWVYEKFKNIGLETYAQNFSVIYPFRSFNKKVVSGENVYAILRARRAASTEALVLSVPLRPLNDKDNTGTGGGIALALGLAQEFKRKPYWSKDIIFLFTEFDHLGAMAWLDSYHQTESKFIVGNDLEARSGPIIAALNLELPLNNVKYFNVKVEGLNGQLPNLDLVNLVVRLCRRERAQVRLHNCLEDKSYIYSENGDSFDDYKKALTTMLKMMWHQASGTPTGNHGWFQKFHIESVTLEGVVKKRSYTIDINTTARIIEGVFRSLNNLLERFHQSFFFYLLPSTSRYVSIGMYMPFFGLMALCGLLKGITLWVSANESSKEVKSESNEEKSEKVASAEGQGDEQSSTEEKTKEKKEEENKETAECIPEVSKDVNVTKKENVTEDVVEESLAGKGLISIVPVMLVAIMLGWMASQGPELLTHIMPNFRIQTEDMLLFSLLAIFMSALAYPKLMKNKGSSNILSLDWQLLKSVALILQTLTFASLALFNISLSFFLTAVMVPVTVVVRPSANKCFRWLQMFALLLISPLSLMYIVGLISSWPKSSALELFLSAYDSCKLLIYLGVTDTHLFNAWTETVMTACIFPVWLLFWALPWIDVPSP